MIVGVSKWAELGGVVTPSLLETDDFDCGLVLCEDGGEEVVRKVSELGEGEEEGGRGDSVADVRLVFC